MIKNLPKLTSKNILIAILLLSLFIRLFRINFPSAYVFDEVYHAFTAKEFLAGSKVAWEWWNTPPPGVAYEWTHPPLAKELMAISMFILHSTEPWAWRTIGVIFGTISVFLLYKISKKLFDDEKVALTTAFIFSLDGLLFVQSRTGMNDIYLVTFLLASLLFLLHKRFLISALFLGFALASKWTAIYYGGLLVPILLLFYFKKQLSLPKLIEAGLFFAFIPFLIYTLSYLPFFLTGHTYDQFIQLHQQMYWYHTNLKATHDYSSPWWSWPLSLFPVWYYVQYYDSGWLSNIFASGNPLLFWLGCGALVVTLIDFIKTRKLAFFVVIWGYLVFWLPWAFSPRIMFLYHYSPSIPFLCLSLGYQVGMLFHHKNNKVLGIIMLAGIAISFALIYPMLTGVPLPRNLMLLFFDINITKNPFG